MNKDSIEFTGHNICEVVKFIDKNKEKRQDVPFMKLLKEGCDVFVFWIEKGKTTHSELRMEKGEILSLTIETRDDEYRRKTNFKTIKFTGKNIIEIVQFIEDWKEMFIVEGYTIYRNNKKIKSGAMDIWWDCDTAMLYLNNLSDGKCTVDGLAGYNMIKGDSSDFVKSE